MKITRKQLRKLIKESLADLFLSNAKAADMIDQGGADYEDAEAHAQKAGKAYYIQNDDEVTELVKDPKTGNVKKVNFGDPNMRIKKSNPKRRKSFRARHNCDNPGPKTKARYWSCKKW